GGRALDFGCECDRALMTEGARDGQASRRATLLCNGRVATAAARTDAHAVFGGAVLRAGADGRRSAVCGSRGDARAVFCRTRALEAAASGRAAVGVRARRAFAVFRGALAV